MKLYAIRGRLLLLGALICVAAAAFLKADAAMWAKMVEDFGIKRLKRQ